MKKFIKSRKIKYGSVAVMLSVLIIVAVIILNMILASLAGRYQWMYVDMNSTLIYSISEDCEEYLSTYVIPEVDKVNSALGEKQKIEIVFCDDKEKGQESRPALSCSEAYSFQSSDVAGHP
jgi:hypothetical protein